MSGLHQWFVIGLFCDVVVSSVYTVVAVQIDKEH